MTGTLSKSDFKLARTCITKLYYRENGYPQNTDENPYLSMLAEGGYMVEQLARLMYPEGVELAYGRDAVADWAETQRHVVAETVTLFEATLLSGRKLARVDILAKRGTHFDLIEVKSKSMDGEDLDEGPEGPFRTKKKSQGAYPIRAPWRPYLEDVAYQVLVLRELFPGATITPYLLVVDKSKTTSIEGLPSMFRIDRDVDVDGRHKDLDVRFIGDPSAIAHGEFLRQCDVSREVDELMPSIVEDAARFAALYGEHGVTRDPRSIDWSCRDCEFRVDASEPRSGFRECWGELADPKPHVFDLHRLGLNKIGGERLGDVMIRNRKTSMHDVDPAQLVKADGTPTSDSFRQITQLTHTRAGTTWIGDDLSRELRGLGWPLHFVDFETSALAVPYHAGMRPYEKVAFQWSCHTLTGPTGSPRHSEWINTEVLWPNLEFARALRAAVGDAGRILTWSPYETTVLREIRRQIAARDGGDADLVAWIDGVTGDAGGASRIFDLNDLCVRAFFHPGMGGRTSIKIVLDALWRVDPVMRQRYADWMTEPLPVPAGSGPYESLPPIALAGTEFNVVDGTDAMRAYQAMLYGAERNDPDTVATYRALLRRYCELDTLAMVLIWEHWMRSVEAS